MEGNKFKRERERERERERKRNESQKKKKMKKKGNNIFRLTETKGNKKKRKGRIIGKEIIITNNQ